MDILPAATLANVDKFVDSQMHAVPLDEIKRNMIKDGEDSKYTRRFTVDGYGKWREVKGEKMISNQDLPLLRDSSMLRVYKNLLHSEQLEGKPSSSHGSSNSKSRSRASRSDVSDFRPISVEDRAPTSASENVVGGSRPISVNDSATTSPSENAVRGARPTSLEDRPVTTTSFQSYKHLSTSLRSNVLPGVGKDKWDSSMKTEFTSKSVPPSWLEPEAKFGYTKDAYMKWAEHDVYRQRLMKAWDKHIANAPKPERQGTIRNSTKGKKPKEERSVEKQVNKELKVKTNEKKKKQKKEKNIEKDNTLKESEVKTRRIEVQPANSDDSFWDFYEKPFAQ